MPFVDQVNIDLGYVIAALWRVIHYELLVIWFDTLALLNRFNFLLQLLQYFSLQTANTCSTTCSILISEVSIKIASSAGFSGEAER